MENTSSRVNNISHRACTLLSSGAKKMLRKPGLLTKQYHQRNFKGKEGGRGVDKLIYRKRSNWPNLSLREPIKD